MQHEMNANCIIVIWNGVITRQFSLRMMQRCIIMNV